MTDDAFREDGNTISIPINPDEEGFTGRECPVKNCEGYFKVQFGTGLPGNIPTHCPYCGITAPQTHFWTKDQIKYFESVIGNYVDKKILNNWKSLERRPDPRKSISFGVTIKGRPRPIHYYQESKLEQEVICNRCTLRYAIYGVFGYCPDCGIHNSLQILNANLDIVEKMLVLSGEFDSDIAQKLIENALEDAVSAMDGFGREVTLVHSSKSVNPIKAQKISFQNISGAIGSVKNLFGIDINGILSCDEQLSAARCFQKRHLIAHRMGVIDQQYLDRTGDDPSLLKRKVEVEKKEVAELADLLRRIAQHLVSSLEALP
jgi:Zn ribbon nucleic-acid-binding protein